MEKVLITVDKNLLTRLDEQLERVGVGSNRSGLIRDACEYYLDLKRGIKNKLRKKEISLELQK